MAASDARPFPLKNTAYRVTFPIFDADGDLVTGAAGLDSEISKDGGTFADCTNEATEIATNSGIYYLDLTSTEMNADTVAIIVKTSTTGAKTTPIIMYPQEADDIKVSVSHWAGTAVATPDTAGYPKVTLKAGTGTGEVSLSSGAVTAGTVNDKTGYSLSSAGIQAIWDALTSALTTANSIGKLLVDNINATISSRLASASYTAPLDAAGTRTAVGLASANLDTQLAAIDDAVDAILEDTADMQPKLGTISNLGGGATIGANLADIEAQTDDIGAAGAGLTAVPWNAAWDEEVESEVTDALNAYAVEGSITLVQALRAFLAVLAGESAGGGTTTITFRDQADTKDRVEATMDENGNRTAVTLDLT